MRAHPGPFTRPHAGLGIGLSAGACVFFLFSMLLLQTGALSPVFGSGETSAAGPSPGLRATLDPANPALGTNIQLTLHYRLPEGSRLVTPFDIGGLETLTELSRRTADGRVVLTFLVDRLDRWQTGTLSLAYEDPEGTLQTLTAPPASAKVVSVLGGKPEDAELRPIADIIPSRPGWLKVLPWAVIPPAAAGLVWAFLWWRRKRRYGDITADDTPPPHVRAQQALQELETSGLFEAGAVKTFYFRFSEIIRNYMEAVRGFPAAELTTEEIARRVQQETDRELLPVLREADLAKFADHIPTPAAREAGLEAVRSYIRRTAPQMEGGA